MLKNLKVGARLALGFIMMIVLLAVIAFLSIIRMQSLNESIHILVEDRYAKVIQVSDAINEVNIIARSLRNMILWGGNLQEVANEEKRILESRTITTDIINKLTEKITSEEGKRRLAAMNAARQDYFNGQNTIMELVKLGQPDTNLQATEILLNSYRTQQAAYLAAWEALHEFQNDLAKKDVVNAEATANMAIKLVLTLAGAAIILAILFAILITRSIVGPLTSCIGAAMKLAKGDTSITFDTSGKDELATLQREMSTMTAAINLLISEMNHMSSEHDAGDIDIKIDAAKFAGSYKEMAEGVNLMVFGHIAVKKKAMACIGEFGRGNFEAPLEKFPGKKAFINDTIEQVRANLKALITDMDMLVQAADAGKLATRADATKHMGDFRKIVDGVNKTLDLVITPVNETIAILTKLAEGDLTLRMSGTYKGDFDVLKTSMNDSLDSINSTLGEITNAVEQVAEGSLQVSQASQALSQGATEQASSLEEITSSTTEISSQTRTNTDNALKVNALAKGAQDNAEKGNIQMTDLVSAMKDINTSAESIKKVVNTIDDIAFQINLLALNANVEAARAGKYGKGFAVVAEEVRNLAVRSAESVKDTTRMVDEAISNIQRGNVLVDGTAKQLNEIVGGASQVVVLAEEVATAGREQTQGLEQISLGLNQIDQVTQSNTASAEESASASEELSSQAQQVKAMLSRFKLKAAEGKVNNAEVMAMLRAELANRENAHRHAGVAQAAKPQAATAAARAKPTKVNPSDIISLDDNNFGKF